MEINHGVNDMSKFKCENKQAAYNWALSNHDKLFKGHNGKAVAYTQGYLAPDRVWPRDWTTYPIWAAGRDNGRKAKRLK